jgi:hypothetical protein
VPSGQSAVHQQGASVIARGTRCGQPGGHGPYVHHVSCQATQAVAYLGQRGPFDRHAAHIHRRQRVDQMLDESATLPWSAAAPRCTILFDRDGTLIEDVPNNGDPALGAPATWGSHRIGPVAGRRRQNRAGELPARGRAWPDHGVRCARRRVGKSPAKPAHAIGCPGNRGVCRAGSGYSPDQRMAG